MWNDIALTPHNMLLSVALFSFLTIISAQESDLLKTYRVYNSVEIKDLAGTKYSTGILDRFIVHNEIECNRRCVHNDACLSVFFNKNNRECQLHGRALNLTVDESTVEVGFRYYQLKRRRLVGETCIRSAECIMEHSTCSDGDICSCESGYELHPVQKICQRGLIGFKCSLTDVCTVDNSECRADGTCGCVAGYSFESATHTCVDGCIAYGNTFQHFPQRVIHGYDTLMKPGTTLEDCQQLCLDATTYKCVSLDFNTQFNDCYHQDVDPTDVPAPSYGQDPSFEFYQHNCA